MMCSLIYAQIERKSPVDIGGSEQKQNSNLAENMSQTPTVSQAPLFIRNTNHSSQQHTNYFTSNPVIAQTQPPANVILTAPSSQHSHITTFGNQSPTRRPPPPYPMNIIGVDQVTNTSSESGNNDTWPQRPNTLALGQMNKKKNESGR